MTSEFTRIDESKFLRHQNRVIAMSCDRARAFGMIAIGEGDFEIALAWESDLVDPIVVTSDDNDITWIGADTRIIAVRASQRRIELVVGIPSNVVDIQLTYGIALVLCETHLIIIGADFGVSLQIDLPDIPETMRVCDNEVVIRMLGGDSTNIRI